MRQTDYRRFDAELAYLGALPDVEVHMHDYFIELPLLANLFRQLSQWAEFGEYRWLIFSRQHDPGLIRMPLDQRTVLFYMSNEDGTLPAFAAQVGCVFTPDLAIWPPPPRVHLIPLGCSGDVPEVAWKPWHERGLDVFFSGQVLPQRSAFIFQTIQLLYDLQPYLELTAQIQFTPRFRNGLSPEQYALTLMNCKICLIPPGISPITLRLFEAMRSGCLLVTHELPPFWYIEGLPAIVMPRSWEGLSEKVLTLLHDPDAQLAMHAATQRHYLANCTPQALGRYVRQVLSKGP